MYEALRHFDCQDADGSTLSLRPGDEVVGFASWPATNQMAALRTNMVRVRPTDVVEQNLAGRPSIPETRRATEQALKAVIAREQAEARGKATVLSDGDASLAADQAEAMLGEDDSHLPKPQGYEAVIEGKKVHINQGEAEPAHSCDKCDFTSASVQGLKLHITRKHKN